MSVSRLKRNAQELLDHAGITINGDKPYDIQVHNDRFYKRVFSDGTLGVGESYMDGWWDSGNMDELFYRILMAELDRKIRIRIITVFDILRARVFNLQKISRAFEIGQRHYDAGNDLYRLMLDKRMTYTGAWWENAANLDEAQEAKLELVCRKLNLKQGQTVLDIGCGWGSFAGYAAEKYGVEVVGITVSKEQVELGRELVKGLPVEIRLQDYRDVEGRFDHIVSLGMIEHVGRKNYRTFMKVVERCLKKEGSFLLQTIGSNISQVTSNSWMQKYIFPNSMLPSISQLGQSAEHLFVMEDWQNLGIHYDKTLMAWYRNFNTNWDKIRDRYSDRFYRMWKYYLLSSAAGFRARRVQLWQILFSKTGLQEGFPRKAWMPDGQAANPDFSQQGRMQL